MMASGGEGGLGIICLHLPTWPYSHWLSFLPSHQESTDSQASGTHMCASGHSMHCTSLPAPVQRWPLLLNLMHSQTDPSPHTLAAMCSGNSIGFPTGMSVESVTLATSLSTGLATM
jgi:hypothetical protein